MKLIYLSLGSNLGDRVQQLEEAIRKIDEHVESLGRVSGIYESESWGFSSKNRFCNCCVSAYTNLEPLQVLDLVLGIEREMGRERAPYGEERLRYTDRIIDIDLLLFGELSYNHPRLILPHPALADRRFVLLPLNELAPGLLHPIHGLTVSQLLSDCKDRGEVRLLRQ